MKKATRDWVRKAEADFRGALRLASAPEPFHDLVAFHCQQSSEKYLKAMLEELGQHIPKTHALDDLLSLLLPSHGTLASIQRGLLFLTDFAVDPRYPGSGTSKREAASAVRWAAKVRDACRSLLGLTPPRPRRKAT
jgi:HEPN domain-containing protein